MLGFFSYFVDGMTGSPAEAATHGSGSGSGEGSQREAAKQRGPIELLLSPAVPLLAAVAPCAFGGLAGEDWQPHGCRIVRR